MYRFTSEDLVQFLYRDTSNEKLIAINDELENNWVLNEEFKLLLESKRLLKSLERSPRKKTIDAILKYAEYSMGELTI
jgi:hypothetical protein